MALQSLFRRRIGLLLTPNSPICNLYTEASQLLNFQKESNPQPPSSSNHLTPTVIPSLLEPSRIHSNDFNIELVDSDTWQVSSGLSESWKRMNITTTQTQSSIQDTVHGIEGVQNFNSNENPDFDEIEDMRIRGNLFYKLDRDSREFEEYNYDFRKRKSSKKNNEDKKGEKEKSNSSPRSEDPPKDSPKRSKIAKKECSGEEAMVVNASVEKKLRSLTFNQLTAPYHEPFCLDIYISKSSVRACIIHRVTSKVAAVAHSISKDMKFDFASTKNYTTCVAVGGLLAQRALADDIHDVVYTPRKGEKVEGKLETVLRSVIDNGINVKVKIKQRKPRKVVHLSK